MQGQSLPVTTLAGLAGQTGSADGTGSAARFNLPALVATDSSGNVYVADTSNHTIRIGRAALAAGDANGDGTISVGDVFYLINFLFAGGPAPL